MIFLDFSSCLVCYEYFEMIQIISTTISHMYCKYIDILFLPNHNIYKSLSGLCFWASDQLIDRFYLHLSIKGYEAKKQRTHRLLRMLGFDEKVYLKYLYTYLALFSASFKLLAMASNSVKSLEYLSLFSPWFFSASANFILSSAD